MSQRGWFCLAMVASLSVAACSKKSGTELREEPLARQAAVPTATAVDSAAPAGPATPAKVAPKSDRVDAKASPADPASDKRSVTSDPSVVKEKKQPLAGPTAVTVKRVVVTRRLDGREPVVMDRLSLSDEPLVAFVELENRSDSSDSVVITFERAGKKSVGHIQLDVPANKARYRTWGKTRQVKEAGTWSVVVRAADGRELARQGFEIEG